MRSRHFSVHMAMQSVSLVLLISQLSGEPTLMEKANQFLFIEQVWIQGVSFSLVVLRFH